MEKMGMEPIYPKRCLSRGGVAKYIHPYLLRQNGDQNTYFICSIPKRLKILADCELILADKDLFECVEVVLLVENQHRFFVVYRVHRTER